MLPQPPPLRAPEAPPPTEEQIKADEKERQLRMSYGQVFGSIHGKIVLADLKVKFGINGNIERPSYRPGMSFDQVANVEGMKEVLRHIAAMQTPLDDGAKPKPTVATT